ncbi:hypothetical protein ASZ78_008009 [Callipepla squamata]|uniref:BRCT domain-containing protein n=1 Tax=Callipepla squamata TaxID=9009 RepID=A0A226N5G3_CALSU|nr:hypothetical protein ASZ78_008009 [Callipepla squamata]
MSGLLQFAFAKVVVFYAVNFSMKKATSLHVFFSLLKCNAAYQCLLIADQHCRTRKYLLCLARGIPCVSHIWVYDSCHANQLQNYRNYLLPAGYSLQEQKLLEW